MVETAERKRALAALAHGRTLRPADEAALAVGAVAIRDLERAAAFVESGGTERLATATERAEADGKRSLARRGQRVLDALDGLSAAATDPSGEPPPPTPVHFHRGHAIDLTAHRQGTDE